MQTSTARVEVLATLAASEARFRAAIDAVNGVLWTNNADGEMEGEQPSWAALTGQTFHEYQGYGWSKAVHPDDAQPTVQAWKYAVAARKTFIFQHRLRRHDGRWRYFSIRAIPILDDAGEIREWVGVHTDVTDQRDAEAALVESETRLRLAQRIGGIGVFEVDLATGDATYSEGYTELHGMPPDITRENIEAWPGRIFPADRARVTAYMAAFAHDDAPISIEYRIIRPSDQALRWIAERREVFRNESGRPVRVIGLQRDVTGQRDAEAVLARDRAQLEQLVSERTRDLQSAQARLAHVQRMEALGQLAGGIAHDFNNVLQAVQGGATLIERRATDPDAVRRLARMVLDAANRGSAVTRRLLTFSRRSDLRAEAVNPAALLADLREILTHTLGGGIGVTVAAPADLPAMLADKGQLETVLINLATNARDAMDGAGVVALTACRETLPRTAGPQPAADVTPGPYIRLSVADSGTGMTPEVLAHVTEPFFTTKKQGEGTGLGLAMARGFVEQSGGAMLIESTHGQGTIVNIWLPLADMALAPLATPSPAGPQPRGQAARLLVVDDEPLVRDIITQQLEAAGHSVLPVADAQQALSQLEAGEPIDLIVTDLSMPGMDGIALLREVNRRWPALPAILLTGFATNAAEIAVGSALSGVVSLLRKPVAEADLAERVSMLLENVSGIATSMPPRIATGSQPL